MKHLWTHTPLTVCDKTDREKEENSFWIVVTESTGFFSVKYLWGKDWLTAKHNYLVNLKEDKKITGGGAVYL